MNSGFAGFAVHGITELLLTLCIPRRDVKPAGKPMRNGVETLEEGTVDRAAVFPRRVVEAALRRSSAAIVCAHNHHNGDVRPSEQDKVRTRALVLANNTAQLKLLDRFIVSPDTVFSFRKEGIL